MAKGIKSFQAKLRRPINTTAFDMAAVVKAAVNPAGSTGLYQVSTALFRRFNTDTLLWIEERSDSGTWREVFRSDGTLLPAPSPVQNYVEYEFDNQLGLLTRGRVLRTALSGGAGNVQASPPQTDVRVTGGYFTMADLGGTNAFSFVSERTSADVTDITNTARNYDMRLLTHTAQFSRFYVPGGTGAQQDFKEMLRAGTPLFVEITFNGSPDNYSINAFSRAGNDFIQCWAYIVGDENSFAVEDSQMEAVNLQILGDRPFTRVMS